MKKILIVFTLVAIGAQMLVLNVASAAGFALGSVVINEIAWAGSNDASSDEWIELYNTTSQSIDLSGWKIVDDGSSTYEIASGSIDPHGYFLIEDNENSVSSVNADAVVGLSLANAGDSLVLQDATDNAIDTVNISGGAWYAGSSTSKATMERIDPKNTLDNASNWASAITSSGEIASAGSSVLGTPSGSNSTYAGEGAEVLITPLDMSVDEGGNAKLSIDVNGAVDLYGYGFEIIYDPNVLNFVSASEGDFLKAGGKSTAFNAAKENDLEGVVIVGNARLGATTLGVDGSGNLFDLNFKAIGQSGNSSNVTFGGKSFLTDSVGDVPAKMNSTKVTLALSQDLTVSNLNLSEDTDRYSLKLAWTGEVSDGVSYVVKKKRFDGEFETIGSITEPVFVDKNNIVPGFTYNYQVFVVKNGVSGVAVSVSGSDSRGIVGDLDRSDRVDGRDIEKLARAYGGEYGDEEYSELFDVNVDGVVDGNDLISLGANFGLTY